MKTLYIDCRSGVSGDMTLGAMLSLGVPRNVLEEGLASLGLNEFDLSVCEKEYHGSPVTDVDVILHNKENVWIHPYSGKYRNYGEIREMIERSGIPDRAKALARRIFDIKAAAESVAHGVSVDEVQFYEVGAAILAGIVDEFLDNAAFDRSWNEGIAKAGEEAEALESQASCDEKGTGTNVRIGRGTGKRDTGLPPLSMMVCE